MQIPFFEVCLLGSCKIYVHEYKYYILRAS
jgi:hypothetical protein